MKEHESEPPEQRGRVAGRLSVSLFPPLGMASICLLTFLAYLPTLRFQFVHDDRGQIVGNPAVHSWHAVPSYFLAHVWVAVAPTFLGNDYRPVFLLWLRINDAIFGLHAAGWHFTTVAAHVMATYAVCLLARRIFQEWPAALFSGLIFGLHPVHIEGVAWISGVTEPLMVALLIPAYLGWLRCRKAGARTGLWLIVSMSLYALALLTKETAVVLLPILWVSEWLGFPYPSDSVSRGWARRSWRILKTLLPLLTLTLVYIIVRTLALKGFSHPAAQISLLTMVLTWPSLLLFYLKLLIWPAGLAPFYGLRYVSHLRNTIVPALALFGVAWGLWRWASHSRRVALAIPWLVFPLLPVLDIQVFGNGNFAHNRYLYLPSVGFAMLVALLGERAAALCRRVRGALPYSIQPPNQRLGRSLFGVFNLAQVAVGAGLALLLGLAIQTENHYYASDAAFYSYAYSQTGMNYPVIGMDYANTLAEQGDFGQAAGIYRKLIQAHPEMWDASFNLGYMLYQQGDLDSAVTYLSRAAAGDPANAGAHFYLGLADLKMNRLAEAEANLRCAIHLAPAAPNYHFALGIILKLQGNWAGALAEFTQELELNPTHQAAAQQVEELKKQVARK